MSVWTVGRVFFKLCTEKLRRSGQGANTRIILLTKSLSRLNLTTLKLSSTETVYYEFSSISVLQ